MDEEFGKRVLDQAFEHWFNPEMKRRQAKGEIPTPFQLHAAQAIFPPEGGVLVRFNEEVRGFAWTQATRDVEAGAPVFHEDLIGMEGFDVLDEDLDNGHLTILLVGDRWRVSFNFLRWRGYAKELLSKSREFLAVARHAQSQQFNAAAVDNLFSACELAAKAYLITGGRIKRENKSHRPIANALNHESKMGNINAAFAALFNQLTQLRPSSRYSAGANTHNGLTADDFDLVETSISSFEARYGRVERDRIDASKALGPEHDP